MKFLGRAKKFLQDLGAEPPAKVQHFNVTCASGHRVRGERTEGYQAIRCPACGDGVFVLPRSPLPEPAPPPRAAGSRRETAWTGDEFVEEGPVKLTDLPQVGVELADRQSVQGEVEIIWDDEPVKPAARRDSPVSPAVAQDDEMETGRDPATDEESRRAVARVADPAEAPRRSRPKPADRTGPQAPGSQPERTEGPTDGSTGQRRRESARRPTAAVARPTRPRHASDPTLLVIPEHPVAPRRRSRLGLIFLLVSLLIIATGSWRIWKQRRQDYPLIAEKGRLEGIPALDAGEFDKAYQLLSAAKTAVDALGGAVEGAEDIRAAAQEADIFVHISNITLEDMLVEAARTEPEVWASRFDLMYKGSTYIFDSEIIATPTDGNSGAYEIDYLVLPPGESSRFGDGAARPDRVAYIDLTGFELFELARPSVGNSVKFGCRLASLQFDSTQNHWVVKLMPRSGVFLSHSRAMEAIGQPVPDLIDTSREEGQP